MIFQTIRTGLPAALITLVGLVPAGLAAQDAVPVLPQDSGVEVRTLLPFEAEYGQMGFPFLARLVRVDGARPVLSFQMIMEGPQGVGIDHVGHFADDLTFAYRRFAFAAFGPEYIDARTSSDSLVVRRMSLAADDPDAGLVARRLEAPVVDGTFAYWLIGALPLREGLRWRWHTWSPTPDGFEERDTPVFEVTGRERVSLADGTAIDAWIVDVDGERSSARMWVSDHPPYLIRQDVGPPGGDLQTVISLERLRSVDRER